MASHVDLLDPHTDITWQESANWAELVLFRLVYFNWWGLRQRHFCHISEYRHTAFSVGRHLEECLCDCYPLFSFLRRLVSHFLRLHCKSAAIEARKLFLSVFSLNCGAFNRVHDVQKFRLIRF